MIFKNMQLESMLYSLKPLLQRRDKAGYVAARNYRTINNALTEFFIFKNDLFKKYGEENKEDNTIFIHPDSENWDIFYKEFNNLIEIEQNVDIMTMLYEEVVGVLSGEEILNVDWMLTETE